MKKYLPLVFCALFLATIATGTGITLPVTGGGGGAGTGDVVGPASSTDEAVARFDGITGKLLQNSTATLDNSGDMVVNDLTISTPSNIYALSHDSFTDYVANEHLLPAAIDHDALLNTHNLTTDIDHGGISGLTDDDHAGYFWLTGRVGGQTAICGTAASNNCVINSTSNATKGGFYLSDSYTVTTAGAGNGIFASSGGSIMNPGAAGSGDYNVIVGGTNNDITRTSGTVYGAAIVGSSNSNITAVAGGSFYHGIFGGSNNAIGLSTDNYNYIFGADTANFGGGSSNSVIVGGDTITVNTAGGGSATLGGNSNTVTKTGAASGILLGASNTLNLAINAGAYNSILGSESSAITETGTGTVTNAMILGGKDNLITAASGTPIGNVILGQTNTISATDGLNFVIGLTNTISGVGGRNFLGGTGGSLSGSNNAFVFGEDARAVSATNAFAQGRKSYAVHAGASVTGYGGYSVAAYDFIRGNVAANASVNNNHFRIAGDTSDVHIGRQTNQAAVAADTNILKLHTTNASNQSNYIGYKAASTLTSSLTYTEGYVSGTIAATDVRKLNATPQVLIAAPGANKIIKVTNIVLFMDYAGTVYDAVGPGDDFQIQCTTSTTSIDEIETVGFMDQTIDEQWGATPNYSGGAGPATPGGFDMLSCDNESIELTVLTGELATTDDDSDGNSPLKYGIAYQVWDLLL